MSLENPLNHVGKGPLYVIRKGEGISHWMPGNGGWTNTILSPVRHDTLTYSMGTQTLAPGESVPEHFHDRHEELFHIIEGHGSAVLDGEAYEVHAGDTLYFGRNRSHTLTNTGPGPLSWVWVFNPPGLEFVLDGVGSAREPGVDRPAEMAPPPQANALVRAVTKRGRPAN